jgi:tetratricopeptide (TPR) repeat protein
MLVIAGAITYALYSAKKRPLFSFCILFFFLNHAIESTILPLDLIFEHRNYIPSMFFFLPIAIGVLRLLQVYNEKKAMKLAVSAFMILLLIGLGHGTYMRNFDWKNEETLWSDAAAKAPRHHRPHHNLGRYYQDHGYAGKAVSEYKKALESPFLHQKNQAFVTYCNLGKIYAQLGDYEKALSLFHKSARMAPDFPSVYNDIAVVFDNKGNHRAAHRYFLKAVALEPNRPETNHNLGLHYLREQSPDKAIYHLNKVLGASAFAQSTLMYLGIAYKEKGRLGRSLIYFKRVLRINPRNTRIHLHLAELYHRAGDIRRAQQEAETAIGFIPDTKTFREILDVLLTKGRSRNLQPCANIVVPLLRKACLAKSTTLREWNDLLEERFVP